MWSSLATLAGLEIRAATLRGIRVAVLITFAVVFALASVFYCLSSLGHWLRLSYSPVTADLVLAFISFAVAACVAIAAMIVQKSSLDRSASKRAAALMAAPLAVDFVRRGLPGMGKLIPLVVIGGFLAGRFGKSN